MNTASIDVLISEVGPRDGLQSIQSVMPTSQKYAWIDALYRAGLREIEVASFVPAKLLPQMADAAQVVQYAKTLPGLTVMALVPNLRGAQAAATSDSSLSANVIDMGSSVHEDPRYMFSYQKIKARFFPKGIKFLFG